MDTTERKGEDKYTQLLAGVWWLEMALGNTAEEACVQVWLDIKEALAEQ